MNAAIAKWICIKAGNLAVRLAPHAGIELVMRVRSKARKAPQCPKCSAPMTGFFPTCFRCEPPPKPELFEATCKDCGADSFEFDGRAGAEVLGNHCLVCQGRRWSVARIESHQQSRRV
jgi:hypothetical protein